MLDKVTSLNDIQTIVQIQKAHTLHGNSKFIVKEVKKNVGSGFFRASNGKVIDLVEEQDMVAINQTQ